MPRLTTDPEIRALSRTTKTPERSTLTSINENDALAQAYVEHGLTQQARHEALVGQREQLPEPVHPEPVIGEKVTSPELASIAARYMEHEDPNVRSLAACVLSQFEKQSRG
jgi:hypothetical protein